MTEGEIKMGNTNQQGAKSLEDEHLLEIGIELQGHKCPAMPLGIRVGLAAMNALGVERAKNQELYCLCEIGPAHAAMCFGDGVQVATGCTFGKNNIVSLGYSKNAITLIEVKSKRAVRVVLNPKFQKMAIDSEFAKLRSQGVEPQDIAPEIVDPLVDAACSMPDEEILIVGAVFNIEFEPLKGTFDWYECDKCGEGVFGYGLRVVNGEHLCIPCSGYRDGGGDADTNRD